MNAETCRKILVKLKDNVDSGMGYTTLAGRMDFSAEQVKEFEASGDPCKSMIESWSSLDAKGNNVLKFKGLVEEIRRDDIVQLLKGELEKAMKKCGCPSCVAIKRSVKTKG